MPPYDQFVREILYHLYQYFTHTILRAKHQRELTRSRYFHGGGVLLVRLAARNYEYPCPLSLSSTVPLVCCTRHNKRMLRRSNPPPPHPCRPTPPSRCSNPIECDSNERKHSYLSSSVYGWAATAARGSSPMAANVGLLCFRGGGEYVRLIRYSFACTLS